MVVWWDPVKKKVIDAITHLLDDLGGSRNWAGRWRSKDNVQCQESFNST